MQVNVNISSKFIMKIKDLCLLAKFIRIQADAITSKEIIALWMNLKN